MPMLALKFQKRASIDTPKQPSKVDDAWNATVCKLAAFWALFYMVWAIIVGTLRLYR